MSIKVEGYSRKAILAAVVRHPEVAAALDIWYRRTRRASWLNLTDLRETFRSADVVGDFTVFNIKGNQYRLILGLTTHFRRWVYIRHFLTHDEYSKGAWKG